MAILTFTEEGNTTEYAMLHPPDVVEKYAIDAIRGVVGNSKAKGQGAAMLVAMLALPVALRIWKLGQTGGWRLSTIRQVSFW